MEYHKSSSTYVPRGWHSRGVLPHFEGGAIPQSVTFRLADSLPAAKLIQWKEELRILSIHNRELKRREKIEEYLDSGIGSCILRHHELASLVQNTLLFFDADRYQLHAWVVMPNHVHVLLTPNEPATISQIVQCWKSFSAKKINALLNRNGSFWQAEYFDRYIRTLEHFECAIQYIEHNPVKAGLCTRPQDWKYSSARCPHQSATTHAAASANDSDSA